MDIQNIYMSYRNAFNEDPLYLKICNDGLETDLFQPEEYFISVKMDDTYSSKHAAVFLNIEHGQTLVNYVSRDDFKDYLLVYRDGRFFKYDWKTLFKFKMIFLLTDKGYAPKEIATYIGTRTDVAIEDPEQRAPKIELRDQNTENLVHQILDQRMGLLYEQLHVRDRLYEMVRQMDLNKAELLRIKDAIVYNEKRLVEKEQQYKSNMLKEKRNAASMTTTGILSWFTSNKKAVQEALEESLGELEQFFAADKENLETVLAEMRNDEEKLQNKIKHQEQEILAFKQSNLQLEEGERLYEISYGEIPHTD